MAQILRAPQVPGAFTSIAEIFWETSARTQFESPQERVDFQNRYLDLYTDQFPQHVLVAVAEARVLGYILGVPDTAGAKSILQANAHLALFEDLYQRYPAHLHINFRAEARGMGLGTSLVAAYENHLVGLGVKGLHLITTATARNVSFYQKNGFSHRVERLWNGTPLLLLGKTLQA